MINALYTLTQLRLISTPWSRYCYFFHFIDRESGIQASLVAQSVKNLPAMQEKESEKSKSYATLCNPRNCIVHGILQARMLEWVAFYFSSTLAWKTPWTEEPGTSPGDLPNPGIEPRSPTLEADSLPTELQGKPCNAGDPIPRSGSPRFPWRGKWQPTLVFLTGKSPWQRSLTVNSPWGHKSWTWLMD